MAVDLHKGGIKVESREGSGSRFIVRLPVKRSSSIRDLRPIVVEPRVTIDAPSIAASSEGIS